MRSTSFSMRAVRWTRAALAAACWLVLCTAGVGDEPSTQPPSERPTVTVSDRALELHRSALVADGHNDLPWQLRTMAGGNFERLDIAKPQPALHTDIERLRRGGVGWQFWAAYVPAETRLKGEALSQTLDQIKLIHELVERYPDVFELASTADDVERIHRAGKIASMIGVEGGHSIQNSLGVLRQFHEQGVRYMTLTHSDTIEWADSATDLPQHGGLSPLGEEVVGEMNRLGMLVDISHVSADTMRDALRVSRAPIIASHSGTFTMAPHPRNVPDDVLKLVAENGGVVMVNFASIFVVPESARAMAGMFDVRRKLRATFPDDDAAFEKAYGVWQREHPVKQGTIHDLVDHIDRIVRVAGIDHAGLGSDFDGVSMLPAQLEDVSCYPAITQELLNRGYSDDDIRKVLGGNILRVMRQAERVAAEIAVGREG